MRYIGILISLTILSFCACRSRSQSTVHSDSIQRNQNYASSLTTKVITETDPTVSWGEDDIVGQKLRRAWDRFAADGHYRMAQPEDFRFSETAKQAMGESVWRDVTSKPYIYWWGAFAVIVVDTTRDDESRFGIILFMNPKDLYDTSVDRGEPYKAVWLNRERDLSRTSLSMASGYWFLSEHLDGGTVKSREVDWSKKHKQYICH